MAVTISVDLRELEALSVRLRALDRSPDVAVLTDRLAAKTIEQTERRYDARRAPDGTPWPPRKDRLPHPILEKTGRQRASIQIRERQETEVTTDGRSATTCRATWGDRR